MRFRVFASSRSTPALSDREWGLVQDRWNDYGFQTQYALYFGTGGSVQHLGTIKILKRGQSSADGLQINKDFESLGHEFVSVGDSLDYYQHFSELPNEERDEALGALRDVVRHPELESVFRDESGWSTSLFRDQKESEIQEFLVLAKALVHQDYSSVPADDLQFSFHPSGWRNAVHFDFSRIALRPDDWFSQRQGLPGQIVAVIGRNGSGKSTLLARLARVGFGTVAQRDTEAFRALGVLAPKGLGFPRIIAISYSAFDSFVLPGLAPTREDATDERTQIVEDARRGEGRFVFCGLRDIASELEQSIGAKPVRAGSAEDRTEKTSLKSIEALAKEFSRTLERIRKSGRERLFEKALRFLLTDSSFSEYDADVEAFLALAPEVAFRMWSTGHKIALQTVASLCAYVTPRSLLLFDEPEMHLHPPLLAALMHAVRHVLEDQRAFGIVATHSPVVIQETLARHVCIVKREGSITDVYPVPIQTFGENVGALTGEIFGVNSEVTDYHRTLDRVIAELGDIKAIESAFGPKGLSHQARAYVMSRLKKGE